MTRPLRSAYSSDPSFEGGDRLAAAGEDVGEFDFLDAVVGDDERATVFALGTRARTLLAVEPPGRDPQACQLLKLGVDFVPAACP
jgi:hypothetical protein